MLGRALGLQIEKNSKLTKTRNINGFNNSEQITIQYLFQTYSLAYKYNVRANPLFWAKFATPTKLSINSLGGGTTLSSL